MFRSAIAAMKPSRREKVSGLVPSGIKSISQTISFQICSNRVMDMDKGVSGGYFGYCGRFGVDLDWCKLRGCKERVNLVFQSILSIGESDLLSDENFGWSQVMLFFVLVDHISIR